MQANECVVVQSGGPEARGVRPANRDFAPSAIRYIKLGTGGRWARQAIADGIIPFGYREVSHAACTAGDWDMVRHELAAMGRTGPGVTNGLREIKDFYELGEDTLWVTIADGHLWWAFASSEVRPVAGDSPDAPSRVREALGGWRRESLTGEPLTTAGLSSALTRTASYRMTICAVDRADYLLRRIKGVDDPLQAEARLVQQRMQDLTLRMIRDLHWEEFETLIDLIFARSGWRRTSVLGNDQPDVDLLLDHPVTNERAWVQVKSKAGQSDLDDYLDRFQHDGSCDRFFFVCHSPVGNLSLPSHHPSLHLWSGPALAATAIEAGLFDWLMQRTR